MTAPQDRPRRRRRRPRQPAGEATEEAGSTRAGQAEPDGSATAERPKAKPPGAEHPKPEHPRAEPGTGRRGEPGRNDHSGAHGRDGNHSSGHGRDGNHGNSGRDSDRGWRELAGSSPSQVGLSGALRARDVARPTPEDLAAAERSVVLVRRGWQPPEG